MSDKRPWSPGPWEFNGDSVIGQELQKTPVKWFAKFHMYSSFVEIGSISKQKGRIRAANAKLTSKAPDMAELLIRLVKGSTCVDIDTFHDILLDAVKILKEVGYEKD